ncbi:hypothetical protein [Lentzea nigeriaca]|uniref:hypothetical protein n=1 Tax=Lentzea nigeriaca TaxID=1128665 RepID=UPI00195A8EE1|nr:hypothetical protein [Lentzea nigeriaca]MBM7861900.1 membrane protein implicated in regulation of membrane protease activity [Lentzea nigeriaca]
MTSLPPLVLLIGLGLAATAVVLLWKLLVTAAGIGLGLWLVVHATADSPGVQLLVFAVAGLAVAAALRQVSPSHRPALSGHHARSRAHAGEEAVR